MKTNSLNKITLEDYFQRLTYPLSYYKIEQKLVESKKHYFTVMYELGMSSDYAILFMNSEVEKIINEL